MEQNKKLCKGNAMDNKQEDALMNHVGGEFTKLPSDIFLDILSRLPLKSVSQCKWVSKAWFTLIHLPRFAELHYTREVHDRCCPSVFIETSQKDFYILDSEVFDHFGTSANTHEVKFKKFNGIFLSRGVFIPWGWHRVFEVLGCVNGLICFTSDFRHSEPYAYYICNPVTRDHIVLSKSPQNKTVHVVSGFGFSSVTNEYKVIQFMEDKKDTDKSWGAEIYTLGLKEWRRIDNIPDVNFMTAKGVLVNANLHWLSYQTFKSIEVLVILCFNVATEEFNLIKPPSSVAKNQLRRKSLYVFEGSLCLIDSPYHTHLELSQIWVMKDYGVTDSWVRQYVVDIKGGPRCWNMDLFKLRNGKILLMLAYNKFGYYDLNANVFEPITIHGIRTNEEFRSIVQFGSLFSPSYIMNGK